MQPAARQRRERQQRRGRVAAGVGDDVGAGDLLAVELGQPVDGAREQLGLGVLAVPLLVDGRVAQAEVGAQVDDLDAAAVQLGDQLRGGTVRIGDDRGVDLGVAVEVELLEHERDAVMRDTARRAGGRRPSVR